MATHAVIHWETEKAYSTVSLSKVDIGDCGLDEILYKNFRIKWQKKFVSGKVVGLGTKPKMTALELQLAQKAADESFEVENESDDDIIIEPPAKKSIPCTTNQNSQQQFASKLHSDSKRKASDFGQQLKPNSEDVSHCKESALSKKRCRDEKSLLVNCTTEDSQLPASNTEDDEAVQPVQLGFNMEPGDYVVNIADEDNYPCTTTADAIRKELLEKDNTISHLQSENSSLKKQLKKFMRLTAKIEIPGQVTEKLVIAPGVELNRSLVELTKIGYITRPSMFLRKLLFEGGLFELDEIAGSSMSGKSSPVSPNITRPCLDSRRFSALKDFTIQTCGLAPRTLEYVEFHQKLKNIPGDARKKLKKISDKKN